MQRVTIGTKYQIVIPKEIRKKIVGLTPGRKVLIYPVGEHSIAIKTDSQVWLDASYGVMEDAWKLNDPVKQVEALRNQWHETHRP